MPRPKPTTLLSIELDGCVWDVTQALHQYAITYKDQPCGVRQHLNTLTSNGFKYQKLSYTNLGNAEAQVNRLNRKFNCTDFGVKQV
jgi:hypothetical protein